MTRWENIRLQWLKAAGWLVGRLGFDGLRALGNGLGNLMWLVVPKRRRLATRNIAKHLDLPEDQAAMLAKSSFRHSARSFLEILLTDRFNKNSPRLSFAQPELWDALCASPRPIVFATGHIGAWELEAGMLGDLYEASRPHIIVVRRYPDPAMQAFITSRREVNGGQMIGHRTVASSVLRALRKNGIVAFLVDHNALSSEALFLPFLGEEAAVNMGPALLAIRAEAIIWPGFLLREGKNYVFHLHEPLDTLTLQGSRDEKVREAALFYTRAVEKIIRVAPEQWFWMHNRWKSRSKTGEGRMQV